MELSYRGVRYQASQAAVKSSELSYRGVRYQASPASVETVESTLIGKYRGVAMKLRYAQVSPGLSLMKLRYRGCDYPS